MFYLIDPYAALTLYLEPNVQKGAAFLDEYVPDWVSKIATDKLDLSSGEVCICGQIFGDYASRPQAVNKGWQYGFNIPGLDEMARVDGFDHAVQISNVIMEDHRAVWDILDRLWLNEVWWRLPEPTLAKREAWIKAQQEDMRRTRLSEDICDDCGEYEHDCNC